MIWRPKEQRWKQTLLTKQRKHHEDMLRLVESFSSLRYERPGRVHSLEGTDSIFKLSGFQQHVIDLLHPFLQNSSKQKGLEVIKQSRTLLSVCRTKDDSVCTKATERLTSLRGSPRDICSWSSFCSSLRAPMDCWFLAKSDSSLSPASVKYFEKCSQLRLLGGNSS